MTHNSIKTKTSMQLASGFLSHRRAIGLCVLVLLSFFGVSTTCALTRSSRSLLPSNLNPVALVNCGGPAYWDPNTGLTWDANKGKTDNSVSVSTTAWINTTNTPNSASIFQNARQFSRIKPGPYRMEIPVAMSNLTSLSYVVELNFAELQTDRRRIFTVVVQNQVVADQFEILQVAGNAPFTAVTLVTQVPVVESGVVVIEFIPVRNNPLISAIAVYEVVDEQPFTPVPTANPSRNPTAPPSQAPSSSSNNLLGNGSWVEVAANNAVLERRHEACFVWVKSKGYLLGGRGLLSVNVYDSRTRSWSTAPGPGQQLHHMQCVVADDKIWIVSAWKNNCCDEKEVPDIWIYDTLGQNWATRAGLAADRRRGSGAAVLYGREIYLVGGARGGHGTLRQTVAWFDRYSIDRDVWEVMPDAPHARDHAGGALLLNSSNHSMLCVAGGRNGSFNDTIAATDCYHFATQQWHTVADLPQERAGVAVAATCDNRYMVVAGGEGYGQAWDRVDIFDGVQWLPLANLQTARHGTGLAVECNSGSCSQIHIASGSGAQGGRPELMTTETFFFDGNDAPCP